MPHTWKNSPIKEKFQMINGTLLVLSAIALYFLAFIMTMHIGFEVISAGASLLATGLAFFGITSLIKNQMIDMENRMKTNVNNHLERMEEIKLQREMVEKGVSIEEDGENK